MDHSRNGVSPGLDAFLAEILGDYAPAGAAAFAAAILDEDTLNKSGDKRGGRTAGGSYDEWLHAIVYDVPEPSAAFAIAILREYDPNEPRDWRGRWTTGGSDDSPTNANQYGVAALSPGATNSTDPGGTGFWSDYWNSFVHDYWDLPVSGVQAVNDATLKPIARGMWGMVIDNILTPMGYDAAAYLLGWSLQDNPSNLNLGPTNFVSKEIAASPEYQAAKKKILDGLEPGKSVKDTTSVEFKDGDLFAAFHWTDMTYSASKDGNGKVTFHATINDRYDFDLQMRAYYGDYGKKTLAVVANNLAWSDQYFGVIHNYNIAVKVE